MITVSIISKAEVKEMIKEEVERNSRLIFKEIDKLRSALLDVQIIKSTKEDKK